VLGESVWTEKEVETREQDQSDYSGEKSFPKLVGEEHQQGRREEHQPGRREEHQPGRREEHQQGRRVLRRFRMTVMGMIHRLIIFHRTNLARKFSPVKFGVMLLSVRIPAFAKNLLENI
jgi:hypothetical protein